MSKWIDSSMMTGLATGDPEAGSHRKDDPNVIHAMLGGTARIAVGPDIMNLKK